MKTCTRCGLEKLETEFYWNSTQKCRKSRCKLCVAELQRGYWRKNKKEVVREPKIRVMKPPRKKGERVTYFQQYHSNKLKEIRKIKEAFGCLKCGIKDHRVLQFHHRKPEDKLFNIGNGANSNLSRIKEEIKKCDVLCANCHAILHYEEVNGNYIHHTGTD